MSKNRANFEFQKQGIELDIAGKTYTVVPSDKLTARVAKHAKVWERMAEGEKAGKVAAGDVVRGCKKIINDLLGGGSFDNIFRGRDPNVRDCANLALFIIREITAFYKVTV